MKKVLIFYGLLVLVIVVFFLSRGNSLLNFGLGGATPTAKIGTKTYKLILAKTDVEKMKGLSDRKSLPADQGMLFLFPKKDTYAFWMKGMLFPIDIIYIDDNKIVDIVENAPAPAAGQDASTLPIYKPGAAANYILEINAHQTSSNKIKKGDTVVLTGIK